MTSSDRGEAATLTRRVLAFAGLPFLSLLTPFIFLPILARFAGPESWLAIAVGQSVGAFSALFVGLGYNTVGPTLVAVEGPEQRREILRSSVNARCLILVPALALASAASGIISPTGHQLEGILMGIAMALTGLSSAWYMVGLGRPRLIVVYELSPRILATLLASLVLVQSGQAIWYPIALIGAGLVGTLLFLGRTVGFSEIARRRRGEVARTLRKNLSVMATEVIGGAYNSLAVSLVSIGSVPSQAAAYVSGDKLYRIGQYSVSALGNAMQGWVVEDSRVHFAERARRSLVLHLSLGTLGLFAFATVGPWLSGLLFGEIVRIDFMTALGLGIATFNIALGTAVGRVILIGLGARRQFLISVIVGASVGIPSILVLATLFGAPGGAWGLATGELASVTCQSIFAILEWRRSGVKVLD